MKTIVWFRGKDLRLADHAPLRDAITDGAVVPLFVLDPYFFTPRRARELPHRMQFLIDSLSSLAAAVERRGSKLVMVAGRSVDVVPAVVEQWGVDRVVAQRWVEPFGRRRDALISAKLGDRFRLYEGETLHPLGTLRSGSGTPYSVFTPFSRAFHREAVVGVPLAAPRRLPRLPAGVASQTVDIPTLESLGIVRNPQIVAGGERAARDRLRAFIRDRVGGYASDRDRMDMAGTSRSSADLKFGTLSPRQIWDAVEAGGDGGDGTAAFCNELVWREFSYSTLWDRPHLLEAPFRPEFRGFPWQTGGPAWEAWIAGRTGYPIVDAASRRLIAEGYVHNRARMIAASFLTKHLLLHYRHGEAHYLKFLTDGDWANNNAGWQWAAGCGCDAQPYFRVFNPVTQGKKFDPEGDYVRRWVPELQRVPARWIHEPWAAPDAILRVAGVALGREYPRPIVDHRMARARFLELAQTHLKRAD